MALDLPLIRRVKNLGAPWIVTSDANGDDMLLLDDTTRVSALLVNLIVRLVEQRATLARFREALDPMRVMIVPQIRTDIVDRGFPREVTSEELIVE